jgi:hypothetical protein
MQAIEHQAMKVAYPMLMGGWVFWDSDVGQEFSDKVYKNDPDGIRCPYGKPGDRLWVRETFGYITLAENEAFTMRRPDGCPVRVYYKAEAIREGWTDMVPWTPSIFMPRWASRIMLEIISVRVERLQDISEADAFAEGISGGDWLGDPVGEYKKLWNSINEKRGFGWDKNPWVWVIEFKKLEAVP